VIAIAGDRESLAKNPRGGFSSSFFVDGAKKSRGNNDYEH